MAVFLVLFSGIVAGVVAMWVMTRVSNDMFG